MEKEIKNVLWEYLMDNDTRVDFATIDDVDAIYKIFEPYLIRTNNTEKKDGK